MFWYQQHFPSLPSLASPRRGDKPSTTLSWHSEKSSSKHIHHRANDAKESTFTQCGFKVRFFRFNEICTLLSELEYRIVWWLVEWMIVVECLYQIVAHNKAIRRKELERFFSIFFHPLWPSRRWLLLSYNNKAIYSTLEKKVMPDACESNDGKLKISRKSLILARISADRFAVLQCLWFDLLCTKNLCCVCLFFFLIIWFLRTGNLNFSFFFFSPLVTLMLNFYFD